MFIVCLKNKALWQITTGDISLILLKSLIR